MRSSPLVPENTIQEKVFQATTKSLLVSLACSWTPLAKILSRMFPYPENAVNMVRPWEQEYAAGGWDWLNSITEMPHNYVIAGYVSRLKPGGTILDVGCGKGVLHSILRGQGYKRYTGIDPAPSAIQAAMPFSDGHTQFVVADARTFETDERFDVIILNEVLYYFADPLAVIRHLERFLVDDGIFIVSMADASIRDALAKRQIWSHIQREYAPREQISLFHNAGLPRKIAVFCRPSEPRTSPSVIRA